MTTSAAIIGSGDMAMDLMIKTVVSGSVRVVALAATGADPDGLARARRLGIATTGGGVEGMAALPEFADAAIVFDATSAAEHQYNAEVVRRHGKRLIDLTSAGSGCQVVPAVNLEQNLDAVNVTMANFAVQAAVPIVSAVTSVIPVAYAEVVSAVASRSVGQADRDAIDGFIRATATALETIGGAGYGKAIMVLNPVEPPVSMRGTVFCLIAHSADVPVPENRVRAAVHEAAARVADYVSGYRLKQEVQFEEVAEPWVPALGLPFTGTKVSVFLEVSGAGHDLPEYAGNLDLVTSAALRTAERLANPDGKESVR